jgi:hypothetical protein
MWLRQRTEPDDRTANLLANKFGVYDNDYSHSR